MLRFGPAVSGLLTARFLFVEQRDAEREQSARQRACQLRPDSRDATATFFGLQFWTGVNVFTDLTQALFVTYTGVLLGVWNG